MNEESVVGRITVTVAGEKYAIDLLHRGADRWSARTRFSETDIIFSDGRSLRDVLERHRFVLPIAVDCRIRRCSAAA
jgi:hypothetical protein